MCTLKKMVLFTLTAALLVFTLTACGDNTATTEKTDDKQAENSDEQTVEIPTITENDLKVADNAALIALDGNATTGYSWFINDYDANALTVNTLGYLPVEAKGMVGTGGTYYYVTGTDNTPAGDYVVTFAYYRSWEGKDTAVNTASVIITVDDNGAATAATPEIS